MRRTTMVRKATKSFVCMGAGMRATRPTARLRRLIFVKEANEITPELLRIEAHPQILNPQPAPPVDDRGQGRMVDAAVGGLCHEHAVAACHVADLARRAGQKGPAGKLDGEHLRILLQYLRGIAFWVDSDGDEGDLRPEIRSQLV